MSSDEYAFRVVPHGRNWSDIIIFYFGNNGTGQYSLLVAPLSWQLHKRMSYWPTSIYAVLLLYTVDERKLFSTQNCLECVLDYGSCLVFFRSSISVSCLPIIIFVYSMTICCWYKKYNWPATNLDTRKLDSARFRYSISRHVNGQRRTHFVASWLWTWSHYWCLRDHARMVNWKTLSKYTLHHDAKWRSVIQLCFGRQSSWHI